MKFIRNFLALMIVGIALILPASVVYAASAGCDDGNPETPCDIFDTTCPAGSDATACQNRNQSPTKNAIYGRDGILTKGARIIATLVGIASVVAIIIGGFKYVLSNGDTARVNSAKDTILYAVVGLVIALVAQAIVLLVINSL